MRILIEISGGVCDNVIIDRSGQTEHKHPGADSFLCGVKKWHVSINFPAPVPAPSPTDSGMTRMVRASAKHTKAAWRHIVGLAGCCARTARRTFIIRKHVAKIIRKWTAKFSPAHG